MGDFEDIEMAEVENSQIIETPHGVVNSSRGSFGGFDSMDSGYMSTTPYSFIHTPSLIGTTKTNNSAPRRHYWLRSEHWQTDRRHRSKNLNNLINASADSPLVDETQKINNSYEQSLMENNNNNNNDIGSDVIDRHEFRMELRDYKNRTRKNQRTLAAITPASRIKSSSSPLLTSPAIPSASFVACEPIDEDVEEKLVNKFQSTPYKELSPQKNKIPKIEITSSPKTSKTSPLKILPLPYNSKLGKLKINEFINVDIKPKRLDFDQIHFTARKNRATDDFTGKSRVDLLSLLGEQSNHCWIVSKILKFMSAQDLCSISMVSTAWRRICFGDSAANKRRLQYILARQSTKENIRLMKKFKVDVNFSRESPRIRCTRGYLTPVHNLLTPKVRTPRSPPVSPSKIKFHSFVKAGRSLAPWERLFSCPKCFFASHVDTEKNVGTCTREGCGMEFCTFCSAKPHSGPCKTPLLATPTKRNTPPLIAGSKQSKRNLRRLLK